MMIHSPLRVFEYSCLEKQGTAQCGSKNSSSSSGLFTQAHLGEERGITAA